MIGVHDDSIKVIDCEIDEFIFCDVGVFKNPEEFVFVVIDVL